MAKGGGAAQEAQGKQGDAEQQPEEGIGIEFDALGTVAVAREIGIEDRQDKYGY